MLNRGPPFDKSPFNGTYLKNPIDFQTALSQNMAKIIKILVIRVVTVWRAKSIGSKNSKINLNKLLILYHSLAKEISKLRRKIGRTWLFRDVSNGMVNLDWIHIHWLIHRLKKNLPGPEFLKAKLINDILIVTLEFFENIFKILRISWRKIVYLLKYFMWCF